MTLEKPDTDKYPQEPPPLPKYDVSPGLKKMVLTFMGVVFANFLLAGTLAIGMRIVQTDVPVVMAVDSIPQNVFWYALLTAHSQDMLFGVISLNTMWFGYYAVSKWGRKPLASMKLAWTSLWSMEAAVVLISLAGLSGFGAGWYNLMPLTFLPGRPMMSWGALASATFLTADVLVGVSLTIFSLVIMVTVLKGKVACGRQRSEEDLEVREQKDKKGALSGEYSTKEEDQKKGEEEYTHMENLPAAVRWVSIIGASSWFPKKWRERTPAVSILVVAAFVTAVIQLVGNPGLFLQLAHGFASLQDPTTASNWLLTKNAWWFFGHPIVYFPILVFLGGAYYFVPRYGKKSIPYNKWVFRPWPFYFMFSMLVFSHHIFMDMPEPDWLNWMSQSATLGIVWPSGLTIITILMYIWRAHISWNITSRFFMVGIAGWMIGGFQGAQFGLWGADIYLHNTMALPGHIHLMLLAGALPMAFAALYAILPDLTKKHMSRALGELHFWSTSFGIFGLAILFSVIGAEGAIRREADMPGAFDWAMPWLLFFALVIGISQFLIVYNFAKTLKRKPTAEEVQTYEKQHSQPRSMGTAAAG